MNFDELTSVWRTQDTAPLHDVNKTLLHLALRQDEAKLQRERLMERWFVYLACFGMLVAMAIFLTIFSFAHKRNSVSVWDFLIAIVGAAVALLTCGFIYLSYNRQKRREEHYGESLRDQINRRLAQLNDVATRTRLTLITLAFAGICPTIILILGWRINGKSVSDDGYMIIWLIVITLFSAVAGLREHRRQVQRVAPQKQRLEELLKQIDGQ